MKLLKQVAVAMLLTLSISVFAQDHRRTISYQGSLQLEGKPVSGEYEITATLYGDKEGSKRLWSATHKAQIVNGIFNLYLGTEAEALPRSLSSPLWLGIQIGDSPELRPYTQITPAPLALNADIASELEGGAVTKINGRQGEVVLKAGTGTIVEAEGNTITISALPVIAQKEQEVTHTITGTANQVLANGNAGTEESGAVTLTLPQNIHTGATPQFSNISLTGIPSGSTYTNVVVSNGGTLETRTVASLGASGVSSLTGTTNQVNVSSSTGDVTLSLPQNIHSSATPTFSNATLTGMPGSSSSMTMVVSNGGVLETRTFASLGSPAWSLTGNSGTTAGTNFIGTTDNQALDLRANNAIRLRFNTNGSIQRDAGGNTRGLNAIDLQVVRADPSQVASGDYSVLSGGVETQAAGSYSTVGGGYRNRADNNAATVAGGNANRAAEIYSTVGGGDVNQALGAVSTVGGGYSNIASGAYATVGGGGGNRAEQFGSFIGGGGNNIAREYHFSAIVGGENNFIQSRHGFIGGGMGNRGGELAAVVSGRGNNSWGNYSFIGAGDSNRTVGDADRYYGAVVAGRLNEAEGRSAFVGAGERNTAHEYGAVAGGVGNVAWGYSAIPGGRNLGLWQRSFGFNADTSGNFTRLYPASFASTEPRFVDVAYFGNINMMIGNVDGTAREVQFYSPNTSYTYSGATYTAFKAQAQSANVTYILPGSQGAANQVLTNDGSGNLSWSSVGGNSWSLTGNSGTTAGTNFIGTTDNQAFEVHIDNAGSNDGSGRVMRYEPASNGPNVIGGFKNNFVTGGAHGATIAGGGGRSSDGSVNANRVTDHFGTVGGGFNNQAGDNSGTTADRQQATVAGGYSNTASGTRSFIGGGNGNHASGQEATIGGGGAHLASAIWATIAGGWGNQATGDGSFIGGGGNNQATSNGATVVGGVQNYAGYGAFVGAGYRNLAHTGNAVVVGGTLNSAGSMSDGYGSQFIGGGNGNSAQGDGSTVVAGNINRALNHRSFIGGGSYHQTEGVASVIVGGDSNSVGGGASWATIVGGLKNSASAGYGFVGGGKYNGANDQYTAVAGGLNNRTSGGYSAIPGGRDLNLGTSSIGFNGDNSGTLTDLYGINQISYLGNVHLWLGNVDNTARELRFYEPNTSYNYSGTNYTAFKGQTQSANVTYTLPASQGAANQVLTNDGSGNLSWSSTPKLSTGSVASADGGTTIPDNTSIVRLSGGASAAFSYSLPSGAEGQLLYIYNNSGFQANNAAANIPDGSTYTFVYINSGWRRAQ